MKPPLYFGVFSDYGIQHSVDVTRALIRKFLTAPDDQKKWLEFAANNPSDERAMFVIQHLNTT